MKQLKNALFAFGFAVLVAAPLVTTLLPVSASAAGPAVSRDKSCEVGILGIPPWYRGLAVRDSSGECSVASPGSELDGTELELPGFIWRIAMNVIEIALFAVGYIAAFFVLYGGFQFLTGGDNSSKVESARKTILNALIGLGISIGSVIVVNLIFGITVK